MNELPEKDASGGEFAVLRRLRARLSDQAEYPQMRLALAGEVFSGDDAAVLESPAGRLLFAIDLIVAGVHFDLSLGSIADAGWKALAVNVSDVAAMGGRPLYAVAGVSAPPGTDLDALTRGMAEAANTYSMALVGGDLTAGEQLTVAVAITGTCEGAPVLRSGARAGDLIWVTGPLGRGAAGLEFLRSGVAGTKSAVDLAAAYRRPLARVQEGLCAAGHGATAMIDISDGLAQDLNHIGVASGVGLRLTGVPVAAGATLQQALGGGEDYELAFMTPPDVDVAGRFIAAGLNAPVQIGECVAEAAVRSLDGEPLPITGWSHAFG